LGQGTRKGGGRQNKPVYITLGPLSRILRERGKKEAFGQRKSKRRESNFTMLKEGREDDRGWITQRRLQERGSMEFAR